MQKGISYKTLIEHTDYNNDLPKDLVNKLILKGICRLKEEKIKFISTGFIFYNDTVIIVFPKAYTLPKDEENLQEHIQILFQTLYKYKREANLNTEQMDLLGGDKGNHTENILIAYRLVQDFIINGILIKEKKNLSSSYIIKIDWQATITKTQPLFSGSSVVYTNPISRRTTKDPQNLLIQIQKYCLSKSLQRYGWIFNIPIEHAYFNIDELSCDISYAINFLTRELNNTFIEREIEVIKMLRDFLSGINQQQNEEIIETLITPFFQNVWEYICSHNFANQYNQLKQIIPKLQWDIESNATVQSQRPDIMVLQSGNLYICDAKYYDIDNNLPGWPDVVKQLFYASTIFNNIQFRINRIRDRKLKRELINTTGISSIFLFPAGYDSKAVQGVGKVNVENSDYDPIKAYRVNTFLSMKCFIGKEKYNFINDII